MKKSSVLICLIFFISVALGAAFHPDDGDNTPPDQDVEITTSDTIQIESLKNMFGPVQFSHGKHASMAEMSKGCVMCHHKSEGPDDIKPCGTCHPVKITDESTVFIGLKGAYHRQCLLCHTEWSNDRGCKYCHAMIGAPGKDGTVVKDTVIRKIEFKDTIEFMTTAKVGELVKFKHAYHNTVLNINCESCHRNEKCTYCHNRQLKRVSSRKKISHDSHFRCSDCHKIMPDNKGCSYCHGKIK